MPEVKPRKKLTKSKEQDLYEERLKLLVWVTIAVEMPRRYALNFINSGLLGHDEKEEKYTISYETYNKYKHIVLESADLMSHLKYFTEYGFAKEAWALKHQLTFLNFISNENLLNAKSVVERQQVVDSIATKIIPMISNMNEILYRMINHNKLKYGTEVPKQTAQV